VKENMKQLALVHVSLWCIGEFGQHLRSAAPEGALTTEQGKTSGDGGDGAATAAEVISLVDKCMRLHSATAVTKSYALNALLKLSQRFSGEEGPKILRLVTRCV
jgi:AP-1 complex subunit gamma-1